MQHVIPRAPSFFHMSPLVSVRKRQGAFRLSFKHPPIKKQEVITPHLNKDILTFCLNGRSLDLVFSTQGGMTRWGMTHKKRHKA